MQAIVLTAGEGAHFHPLTLTRPKGMSIVAGKPILQHTAEALVEAGIRDILFVVGYKPERVRTFFGNGKAFGFQAHYVEQPRADGTGAALRLAAQRLPHPDRETLAVFGDNHYEPDLVRRVLTLPGDVVLAAPGDANGRHGLLVAKNGRLSEFKLPAQRDRGLVATGLFKITPGFLRFLTRQPAARAQQLPHALHDYAQSGAAIHVPQADEGWDEAETVWELLRLNERLLQHLQTPDLVVPANVTVEGPVRVGANTILRPGARLIGPTVIGTDCEIRENAVVGPNVSLRNNVHVGSHSEVRNAIVNNNAYIDSQCVVRFSILDDGVRLGPFAVLGEGDAPQAAGARVGSVLGPDTRLGARVTVKPGTILAGNTDVEDGAIVAPRPVSAQVA